MGITTGSFPSITDTHEFVVPKSIPIILLMMFKNIFLLLVKHYAIDIILTAWQFTLYIKTYSTKYKMKKQGLKTRGLNDRLNKTLFLKKKYVLIKEDLRKGNNQNLARNEDQWRKNLNAYCLRLYPRRDRGQGWC